MWVRGLSPVQMTANRKEAGETERNCTHIAAPVKLYKADGNHKIDGEPKDCDTPECAAADFKKDATEDMRERCKRPPISPHNAQCVRIWQHFSISK